MLFRSKEWRPNGIPRRAAVSSFGMGGTNSHAVLEEAPGPSPSDPGRAWQLLVTSARSQPALERQIANMAAYLKANPGADLADVAFTYQVGRRRFPWRCVLPCESIEGAVQALEERGSAALLRGRDESADRSVVFLFPGQGTQYPNMARELYEAEPEFRVRFDECAARLSDLVGADIRALIYPADECSGAAARAQLNQTAIAQPALFAVEYALARLWVS